MNKQQRSEFFNELAIAMGINYLDTVQQYYFGFVKLISRSLASKGEIRLPDFGTFYLKTRKARKLNHVRTKIDMVVPEQQVLKFKPDYKLNHYIKNR